MANTGEDTIQHIDALTGRAAPPIQVGGGPDGLALDGQTLWVSEGRDGTVSHLDTTSGKPVSAQFDAGPGARGIAVAHGSVWVANIGAQTVSRLDP